MRTIRAAILALLVIYIIGYAWFRSANAEVWERDGNTYVIYPVSLVALYYLWRPLAYLDNTLTGMRTHIGPHPE